MEKRPYNIFFDLHTVSGIVLSVLLFVIFFAGSFSFFRDEIVNWERNETVASKGAIDINVDAALDTIAKKYTLYGREVSIHKGYDERRVRINVSASIDTTNKEAGAFLYMDTKTFQSHDYISSYTLGEFLYRLHFFAQIPYPVGYYLSGFTALFLFFIVLTGILIHWKKIISNFYLFRPFAKLKTIWTDAHTALGTIGLPFQVVYAITGAFFMINIFLVIPDVLFLYDGDREKIYEDLGYAHPSFTFEHQKLNAPVTVNAMVAEVEHKWNNFQVTEVHIMHYGDKAMHVIVSGELERATQFTGTGEVTYKASTGEIVHQKDPYEPTTYLDGVKNILYRLHFADYGGYGLKVASFLLGLLSCFVIISGILIWLEARNKKNVPEKKKRFNNKVSNIYLAICLAMYPVTALAFIVVRFLPADLGASRQPVLYSVYFGSWLLLSIFLSWKQSNFYINKYTLLSGAILGMVIPVVNGVSTGNWIWYTMTHRHFDIFIVDALWIGLSLISFYTVYRLKGVKPSSGEEDSSAEDTIEPPAKKRPRVVTETIL
jgi:uncharacterized iron-regulated membrane protein